MKKGLYFLLFSAVLLSAPGTLLAQDYEYHPALSDNFSAVLGAMRSSNSFKVSADGLDPDNTLPEDEIVQSFGGRSGPGQYSP